MSGEVVGREQFAQRRAMVGNELILARLREDQRVALIEGSVSLEDAIIKTGATNNQLRSLIRMQQAAAFEHEDNLLLPTWQLQQNSVRPILDGVAELLRSFPGDLATLHSWMSKDSIDFFGTKRSEVFKERPEYIIGEAHSIASAGR